MIKIAPSILAADFARLGEEVRSVEEAGADLLHIDVMDGHFVPNITFGPNVVKSLRSHSRLKFDVHLMIEEPERYIEEFARAGADHITIHMEATPHVHRAIQLIKNLGLGAGVALNPATGLDDITYLLEDLDLILVMTVNPGFGGQKFIPNVLPKIKALRERLDTLDLSCHIEVDGGIQEATAPLVVKAGADILVAGAAIFAQTDPGQALKSLRQAISGGDE